MVTQDVDVVKMVGRVGESGSCSLPEKVHAKGVVAVKVANIFVVEVHTLRVGLSKLPKTVPLSKGCYHWGEDLGK